MAYQRLFSDFASSSSQSIEKILVANRGEIACQITRTMKRLGIRIVVVYNDADRDALHVKSADESILIGPPPARFGFMFWAWVSASLLCFGHGFQFGFVFQSNFSAFILCSSSLVLMGTSYNGGVVAVQ